MSDTKFTPGPWDWNEDKWNGGWSGLFAEDDTPVLVPQSRNDGDDGAAWFATVDEADEEGLNDADRALIAAAPELYEALTRCKFDSLNMTFADLEFCEAAMAKARGEKS